MRHFENLSEKEQDKIFFKKPSQFNKQTDKEFLAISLGATMYSPATDLKIAKRLIDRKYKELTCNVWCLEDAIHDSEVEKAVENVFYQSSLLEKAVNENKLKKDEIPLLFIRVRSVEQLKFLLENSNTFMLSILTGFNIPKFSSNNAEAYLSLIDDTNVCKNTKLYVMPILESEEIMYQETRREELIKLKTIIDIYQDIVLNIRLGGTDFSSLFGLRRSVDFTVYDVAVVNGCISDIVNMFGRATENYTISGVVWEYFPDKNRLLRPQLRRTPFERDKDKKRNKIVSKEIDGLIKEIILDKANGLLGKTIIHPSHIKYVNALQVVTYEEYLDASNILDSNCVGVCKSNTGNKMNETKPHFNWATKIIRRANIYGVLNEDRPYVDLF